MPRLPVSNPFNPMANANERQLLSDLFYTYTGSFGSITTLATGTQNIQITTDADFWWCETTFYGNDHTDTEPYLSNRLRPFTIQINDGGISHGMFNIPIPVDCIAGTAQFPFILPIPYMFARGSNVSITLTSLSAHMWDNIYVALSGYKNFQ